MTPIVTPPAEFSDLSADELALLDNVLRTAREQRSTELAQAIEAALRSLPALVRGPVRKIMGV